MEDLPWEVTCVNRITGESRDVPYGEFNEDRGYCNQPEEYKVKRQIVAYVLCRLYRENESRSRGHIFTGAVKNECHDFKENDHKGE